MAFGILRALKEFSINVPQNVALTGFDNVKESAYLEPSLTTIGQNLSEQGKISVTSILKIIQGETIPPEISVKTKAYFRESCGCHFKEKPS